MTNVSKKSLTEKELNTLREQMSTLISKLNRKESSHFFNELLGPEEQIMLLKRLAAVAMYTEGNSSYRVWTLLKMSPSTAETIRNDFENDRYTHLKDLLTKNKTDYETFWKALELILSAGMPPRGRGRWKSVFNQT